MCEDAPCCGCCGPQGDGGWHDEPPEPQDADERGWPGDGSGQDDLADANANEADDYRNEGAEDTGPEDFGWGGDEALCGE